MNSHVAIMARLAELGVGKRRIAKTAGDEKTLQIYRQLSSYTAKAVADSGLPATVFFDPEIGDAELWPSAVFAKAVQAPSASLGERIYDCLAAAMVKSKSSRAIVIGADCPYLTGSLLRKADGLLDTHDAVLGPSTDGGYYLLALKQLHPSIFALSAWSEPTVAEETRVAIRALGWSIAELPALTDIDTEAQWQTFVHSQTSTYLSPKQK